ncbi:MAG: hypothetical protein ACMUJM_19890 [bacterium]
MKKSLKYITIGSFFIIVIFLSLFKIETFDFGWHLKTGEYIYSHKSIPTHDMFSYIVKGHKWVDSHWLFQLVLYIFYRGGGITGVIFLRILVVVCTFVFLFLTIYRKEYYHISIFVCLCALFISFQRFFLRPEIFTFFFLTLFFYYTERFSEHPYLSLTIIPLCQVLWANMHGLHLLGIIFLFLYLLGDLLQAFLSAHLPIIPKIEIEAKEWKQKGILFCLTCFALLLNANGRDGIVYPYKIFHELKTKATIFSHLTELISPFAIKHVSFPEPIIIYKIFLFLSLFVFICQLKRIRLAHVLPYGLFLYLSLLAIRNMPLFALIATPGIIHTTHGIFDFFLKGKRKGLLTRMPISTAINICVIILSASICVLIANNTLYQRLLYLRAFGIGESDSYPKEAVDYLKEKNIAGNIFNSSEIGGYLIWKMYPLKHVALDGRWEVYEDFLENIQQLGIPRYFSQLAGRYKIRAIILYKRSLEFQLMSPWLLHNPFWILTKDTPTTLVFELIIG